MTDFFGAPFFSRSSNPEAFSKLAGGKSAQPPVNSPGLGSRLGRVREFAGCISTRPGQGADAGRQMSAGCADLTPANVQHPRYEMPLPQRVFSGKKKSACSENSFPQTSLSLTIENQLPMPEQFSADYHRRSGPLLPGQSSRSRSHQLRYFPHRDQLRFSPDRFRRGI